MYRTNVTCARHFFLFPFSAGNLQENGIDSACLLTFGDMDLESTRLFNDRLAQWVAKQGFWFQIRYSMAGGGTSVLMYHLLRILMRVGIFVLIIAAVVFYMLMKRTDQPDFRQGLSNQIINGLDAKSGKMYRFNRTQNKASIRYLTLEGGPKSFMNSLEAAGISFRMGLLDGITSSWDLNQISVDRMSVQVKAGAETDREAQNFGHSFIKNFDNVHFQSLQCSKTRVAWGYSPRTMGSISESHMTMIRDGNGWRMRFTGGYYSQNWLQNLQIDELVLRCDDQSLVVEKGEFTVLRPLKELSATKTHGKVTFQNVQVRGGQRPEFSGSLILENVPLDQLLPETYQSYIQGSISGLLKINGSTNSPDGISLVGRISLTENDEIDVRNRLHILNSLSIISPAGSYRKVAFKEGFFTIRTTAGSLEVTDINLSAPDQMELRGGFLVRPPKQAEIDDMLRKGSISKETAKEISMPGMAAAALMVSKDLTLAQAMNLTTEEGNKSPVGFDDVTIDSGTPFQIDELLTDLQMKTTEILASTAVYEGRVVMTLPVSVFSEDLSVVGRLPLSANGKFYLLECPLLGNLDDLTLTQAEELLAMKKLRTPTAEEAPQQ